MKKFFIMCSLILATSLSVVAGGKISIQDINSGVFAAKKVGGMRALPDGETYSRISDDKTKIIACYYKNGQQASVLFDVNNTVGEKIGSFDDYIISPDGTKMLIKTETKMVYRRSSKAKYYVYNIANKRMRPLSDNSDVQNPVWSNDGNQIAFVRNNNIWVSKLLFDGAESQITKDGEYNKVINGIPDWVNEEEFATSNSLCFNADGTMICWIKYEEANVKEYSLQMFKGMYPSNNDLSTYPGEYTYKYPKAGEDNSKVSAWSYDIKSHVARKIELPLEAEGYIPRIIPTADANSILLVTLNRHQDDMRIYSANPRSSVCQMIVENKSGKYVKEESFTNMKVSDNYILVPCDKGENITLNVHSINGSLKRSISLPNKDITEAYGIDPKTGDVYFQAASPTPKDRQVFVSRVNGKIECLTPEAGTAAAQFSESYKYFLKTWSNADTPFKYSVCNGQGKDIKVMEDNAKLNSKLKDYPVTKKEFFTFKTSEGVQLEGWMIKPADFDASKKYPVIMHQYSGPGSQQVVNSWNIGSMGNGGMYDYLLAEKGFIVVSVDGRGTGYRGTAFEKCIYQRMGDLESKDQVETAIWLGQQSFVDKERIAIWGWSFGGFNTLMAMSEGRPVFCCGVAIAPPTDWRFYDSIYTERYMRTPKENNAGYDINPKNRVNNLHGALLLVHGLADDNVHPQNTFEYSEAMVQADKDFKELIYTNRNHGIHGGNTRNHLLRQVTNWFVEHMMK